MLGGKPVIVHAIERLREGLPLDHAYVLLARDDRWYDDIVGAQAGVTPLRCGGESRAATVRNALDLLSVPGDGDWIVVHDAVRPCVDAASMLRLRQELFDDAVGGLLALPVTNALKRADDTRRSLRTEVRDGLWQAQTPQMFRCKPLRDALARPDALQSVDEAQALEAMGLHPRLVEGSPCNLKITYRDDLALAEAILSMERAR